MSTHRPHIVSKAEYAREWGVTAQTVAKWAQRWLAPAVTPRGIDRAHPVAMAGPPGRDRDPTWVPTAGTLVVHEGGLAKPVSRHGPNDGRGGGRKPDVVVGSDEDLEQLTEFLAPLAERFGMHAGFKDWLQSLKTLEDIRGKRLQNDETENSLISRELVRVNVFGLIEGVFRRLLTDSPKTIARLVYAEATAGRPVEDAEKLVRKQISAQLKTLKARAKLVLGDDDDSG